MPKIQLGDAPETFPHKVTFPLVTGGEDHLNITYQYRDREEFAEFIAGIYPNIKSGPSPLAEPGYDIVAAAKRSIESDVQHILGCVRGWDLADAVDAASVRRLATKFPAAADAIMNDYRIAITEGRTKNW